ncbi:MAG: universal stress protein [Verrucomicrobiales bacterium]
MKTFGTIVVGIDFSDASLAALREAIRLARDGGRVVAVEVVEKELIEDQIRFHQVAAEQALDRIHSNLIRHLAVNGADHGVEARVIVGSPFTGLIEVVEAVHADVLVLGSRGWDHNPGSVGTVAARCVRKANLPVMLVRRHHHGAFHRIVACTDYSPTATMAVQRAGWLAREEGAMLDLVHVDYPVWLQPVHIQYDLQRVPEEGYRDQYRALMRERLANHLVTVCPDAPSEWKTHVLEDVRASDAIARFLKEVQADLVVLGTAGRSGLNALLLGTTAERLIHRSECSVLAIKPPAVD